MTRGVPTRPMLMPLWLGDEGYVTDGARLFRVVAPMEPRSGICDAVLEDCLTLALQVYSASELWRLRLRRVDPRSGEGGR